MNSKFIIVLGLTFILSTAFAQKTIPGQANWLVYTGQYKLTNKFGAHLEVQWRGDTNFEQNRQNLFRIGGIYYLNNQITLSAGYGLIKTFKPSLTDFFTENRAWEQIQYNHKWFDNKNLMTQRFRLEQRFVDNIILNSDEEIVVEATNYQNRLRYLNRNLFHLFEFNTNRNKAYAILQDEFFFNLGYNKVNANFFDQNRLLIGFGINYEDNTRLEVGYLNHLVTPEIGNNIMNHNVSMSITHNLDFTNSKK